MAVAAGISGIPARSLGQRAPKTRSRSRRGDDLAGFPPGVLGTRKRKALRRIEGPFSEPVGLSRLKGDELMLFELLLLLPLRSLFLRCLFLSLALLRRRLLLLRHTFLLELPSTPQAAKTSTTTTHQPPLLLLYGESRRCQESNAILEKIL